MATSREAIRSMELFSYRNILIKEMGLTNIEAEKKSKDSVITSTTSDAWMANYNSWIQSNSDSLRKLDFIYRYHNILKGYYINEDECKKLYNTYAQSLSIMHSMYFDLIGAINNIIKERSKNTGSTTGGANQAAKPQIRTVGNVKRIDAPVTPVYPSTFANFDHPTEPFVTIQFRTKYSPNLSDLTDQNENNPYWVDISKGENGNYQNKFFVSMELEDNKGVKRLNLTLRDKYYTTLEKIVMNSIFSTILTNKLGTQTTINSSTVPGMTKEESDIFSFMLNGSSFINLRIKFGYSYSKYIDPSRYILSGNYSSRTTSGGDRPVLQSPWLYFQIMGAKQSFGDDGLTFTINAITSSDSFLSRAKLVKRFAKLEGTPSYIINEIRNVLNKASGMIKGSLTIVNFDDKGSAEGAMKPEHDGIIEIVCGSETKVDKITGKPIEEYRPMRELLDDICSKVPPLLIKEDGSLSTMPSDSETSESQGDRLAPYSYYVNEDTENKKARIIFRYENPDGFFAKKDIKLRTYFWREYPKTVVKNISISTDTDFAQMNMPLIEVTNTGSKKVIMVGNKSFVDPNDKNLAGITPSGFVATSDLDLKNFDFSFVADGGVAPQQNAQGATDFYSAIKAKFLKNINGSIFRGTIDLDGDPFYLFDKELEPFNYLIKVIIMRPSEEPVKFNNAPDDTNKISYLSGFYAITNIKHTMSDGGFTTSLEVMRWPSLYATESTPPIISTSGSRSRTR